jgi:hypothetical protein
MRESASPSSTKPIYEQFSSADNGMPGFPQKSHRENNFCPPKPYDPVILSRKSSGKRSRISAGSRS